MWQSSYIIITHSDSRVLVDGRTCAESDTASEVGEDTSSSESRVRAGGGEKKGPNRELNPSRAHK